MINNIKISMEINLIVVISVVGFLMIVTHIRTDKRREESVSRRLIGNYIPTMSDIRLNDGGSTFIPNIFRQPVEGRV